MWIDTHCHLDAEEFDADRDAVVERARAAGVTMMVLPAAHTAHFAAAAAAAARYGFAYALGLHPLWLQDATADDLARLREAARAALADPRFVAIGEIGLDYFVADADRERQRSFYREQLRLARELGLPVILHVRRSADDLLSELRRIEVPGGIAHAFNGSAQQAGGFIDLGFALGFGGAMTFDRALNIRRLATLVPDTVPVLETDAPDIPPQWLYVKAAERAARPPARNEPAELPRIAATLAGLRGWSLAQTAERTTANACAALPRLAALLAA